MPAEGVDLEVGVTRKVSRLIGGDLLPRSNGHEDGGSIALVAEALRLLSLRIL